MSYNPFKMKPKSPLMKKLVGGQKNLPEHLKNAIEASPMRYEKDPKEMVARKKKEAKQKQLDKQKKKETNKAKTDYARKNLGI